jgi:long-chain acyl-CoA synthetase
VPDVHNFADLVRRNAADRGDRPALRSPDEVLTWSELDAQVDAVAADLARIAGGAPVAIALPNGTQFAVAYFATLRAGLVAVPINPGYTGRELRQILGDAHVGVLIATDAVWEAAGSTAATRYTV